MRVHVDEPWKASVSGKIEPGDVLGSFGSTGDRHDTASFKQYRDIARRLTGYAIDERRTVDRQRSAVRREWRACQRRRRSRLGRARAARRQCEEGNEKAKGGRPEDSS